LLLSYSIRLNGLKVSLGSVAVKRSLQEIIVPAGFSHHDGWADLRHREDRLAALSELGILGTGAADTAVGKDET
jgi:hypothetical protein